MSYRLSKRSEYAGLGVSVRAVVPPRKSKSKSKSRQNTLGKKILNKQTMEATPQESTTFSQGIAMRLKYL